MNVHGNNDGAVKGSTANKVFEEFQEQIATPSTSDYLGEVGFNLSFGLGTACYGRNT